MLLSKHREKMRVARLGMLAAIEAAAALGLSSPASAQGVTVIHGRVTIDDAPAPAWTEVNGVAQDGTVVGAGVTGTGGLDPDQYRVDIQSTSNLEGQTVSLVLPGFEQRVQAVAVFAANRAREVDIQASTPGATPTPTATPSPTPTSTPTPTPTPEPSLGTTVFTGLVTLDFGSAPAATAIRIALEDGPILALGATGPASGATETDGLAPNEYAIEVPAPLERQGLRVIIDVIGAEVPSPVTVVFRANETIQVNIVAFTLDAEPTPTPFPNPTPKATPAPTPTATQILTATPFLTPTLLPTATPTPIDAPPTLTPTLGRPLQPTVDLSLSGTPRPSPTPFPTRTPRPTPFPTPTPTETPKGTTVAPWWAPPPPQSPGGGGYNLSAGPNGALATGWLLLAGVAPGLYLATRRRR